MSESMDAFDAGPPLNAKWLGEPHTGGTTGLLQPALTLTVRLKLL